MNLVFPYYKRAQLLRGDFSFICPQWTNEITVAKIQYINMTMAYTDQTQLCFVSYMSSECNCMHQHFLTQVTYGMFIWGGLLSLRQPQTLDQGHMVSVLACVCYLGRPSGPNKTSTEHVISIHNGFPSFGQPSPKYQTRRQIPALLSLSYPTLA